MMNNYILGTQQMDIKLCIQQISKISTKNWYIFLLFLDHVLFIHFIHLFIYILSK